MNKFSVIVPIYNSSIYLDKCITSIINQTYDNIEIILVNDGSTDNSYEICQGYEKLDSRIKLIDNKHSGVSASRSAGIKNSTGDYILFVDSDDYLDINAISEYNYFINNRSFDLLISEVSTNASIIYNTDILNKTYTTKSLFYKLNSNYNLIERINSIYSKVYKANIIHEHNLIFDSNIKIGEDLLFNIHYLNYCNKIFWTNKSYYHYFIYNPSSITKKFIPNKYEQLAIVNNALRNLLLKFNEPSLLNIQKYSHIKNIYSCFFDLYNSKCTLTYKQKILYIKNIRKENGKIIIKKPFSYFILSICYSFLPVHILLSMVRLIYLLKKQSRSFRY